eukprot:jgi/Tetstr1/464813/TSEL_009552.t1
MGVTTEAAGPVASSTPHGMLGYGRKAALKAAHALARKQGSVRNYLARHYLRDVGKDPHDKGGRHLKHNTNAVKNLAATPVFHGDNVDEGNSPELPAKKAKQPGKPAAGVPSRGRGCAGPGRAVGRSGRGPAAKPPWQ